MKRFLYPAILIILTFWAIKPLLHGGFFPMHDDQQIARLYELNQALKGGQFPPRWVSDLGFGYGYPLFNFYPPLVYYLGEFFHLLGFSLISSIKIVMGTGFIISGLTMFFLAKKFVNSKLALLAALLYIYAPYRSLDVYVRGALAESFAFVFYPLILLFIKNLSEKPNLRNLILLSLSTSGLILTHSLMVFPFAIFAVMFYLYQLYINKSQQKKILLFTSYFLLLTLSLTAYFSFPSLFEKKYTLVDNILTRELANYKLHFVYLRQFWNSPWGYGGSIYGLLDGMSFEIGKTHLILLVILLPFVILNTFTSFSINSAKNLYKKFSKTHQLETSQPATIQPATNKLPLLPFAFCLVLSVFLASFHSQFLWNFIKPLWYIQFPWRFLSFTTLFLPLVIVLLFNSVKIPEKFINIIVIIVVMVVIFFNHQYFQPARYLEVTDQNYITREDISWRISKTSFEFVPKGVKTILSDIGTTQVDITKNEIPTKSFQILKENLKVSEIKNLPHQKIYQVQSIKGGQLRINTYNFPGWEVSIDGQKTFLNDQNKLKLITVKIPAGAHEVTVKFQNTPIRTLGNYLSLFSLIMLVFLSLRISHLKLIRN